MMPFDAEPIVSIGSSQREWAAELTRFVSDYGGARLRGTVLTLDDALEQEFEVLIVDDIASYLNPRFVDRLRKMQRSVVGVYDPEQGDEAKDRLMAMGVDVAVEADASPDEFLEAVLGVRSTTEREAPEHEVSVPAADDPAVPARPVRNIVAVVGGDEATEVALALCDVLVGLSQSTVLVDADTLQPALAQRLGLPLGPNLLTALDALLQLRGAIEESLQPSPRGFSMLVGLPETGEWDTVRPSDVVDLVDQFAVGFDHVVTKLSPSIEDLSSMGGRVGRFDISRSVLAMSEQVVAVAPSTPIGLTRLLGWIARLRTISTSPLHVVFHDAPRSVFQRGELSEELVRSFVPASITWLPSDARLTRAAWNGEMVPAGPYLRSVSGLGTKIAELAMIGAGA